MKKFLALLITPILSSLLILIHIPIFEKWLNIEEKVSAPYLMIAVVSCVLLSHIISVVSPFKKYERINKNKWLVINEIASLVLDAPEYKKYNLNANVMTFKRAFFCTREPSKKRPGKRKIRFFCRMFKFVWYYNDIHVDKRIKLTTRQGASGMSYNFEDSILKHVELDGWEGFDLNEDQKKAIINLQLIISYPIFAMDSGKVIGMVNVSSNSKSAKLLVKTQENRDLLTKKVIRFSQICSYIM